MLLSTNIGKTMNTNKQFKLLALGLSIAVMPTLHGMETTQTALTEEAQQQEKLNQEFRSSILEAVLEQDPVYCKTLLTTAKSILDLGAEIDHVKPPYGITALTHAAWANKLQVVQFLVQHGAKIDLPCNEPTQATPLMFAGLYNSAEVFLYLLEQGADIYLKDVNNTTVFDATPPTHHPICNILLQDAQTFYEMPEGKAFIIGTDSDKYSEEVKELGFNIMFNKLEFFNLMDIHHYDKDLHQINKNAFKKGICLLHLQNQPQLIKCIENNWHQDALDDIKDIVKSNPNSRYALKIVAALGKTNTQNGLGKRLGHERFSDIIIN